MLNEEIKEYLKSVSFAVLCMPINMGKGDEAVVIIKSTGDVITVLKAANAQVNVGWFVKPTNAGPVICMCIKSAHSEGELFGEAFFDIADPGDKATLKMLASQERLVFAMFDEEMELKYYVQKPLGVFEKIFAEQSADRAEELLERVENPDFDKAREIFLNEVEIKDLMGSFMEEKEEEDAY